MFHSNLEGPVNLVSPTPVMHSEFIHTLAQVLHRPQFLKLPALWVQFLFGQRGKEVLLSSSKIYPKQLLEDGFQYRFPELKNAMDNMLER